MLEYRFSGVELRESATGPGRVEGVALRYADEAQLPGFRERFHTSGFFKISPLTRSMTVGLTQSLQVLRPPRSTLWRHQQKSSSVAY